MLVDLDKPVFGTGAAYKVADHLDAIRNNFLASIISQGNATGLVPGWAMSITGADPSLPDTRVLTGPGGRKIKFTYTYTDGAITQIDIEYDANGGLGYEAVTPGTVTIAYDGDGNPITTTWT